MAGRDSHRQQAWWQEQKAESWHPQSRDNDMESSEGLMSPQGQTSSIKAALSKPLQTAPPT